MEVLLSLDLGTSGCRVAAFGPDGRQIGFAEEGYATQSPVQGWAEQDPQEWWEAVCRACHRLFQESPVQTHDVVGLGLTAQMAGLVVLGRDGQPLCPATTWADDRARREVGEIDREWGDGVIYSRTGCPPRAIYALPKLMWLKEQTSLWPEIERVFSPKDYIAWRLTDEPLTDPSTAGATQLFHVDTRQWDPEILEWLGLQEEKLPAILPSETICPLNPGAAAELGLTSGIPVVLGAGDGVCATLGSAAVEPGTASCNVGTSAAIRMVTVGPSPDTRQRVALYPLVEDLWIKNGATNNAGAVLAWFADSFYGELPAEQRVSHLLNEAASLPDGADGLSFLPYVFGDRNPEYVPPGSGGFYRVSPKHTRAHFARAVLEGTLFVLKDILDVLGESTEMTRLVVTGRVAGSAVYRSLLADATGLPVEYPGNAGATTGLGAAIIAAVGLGLYPSYDAAVGKMATAVQRTTGHPDRHLRFVESYREFQALRSALHARENDACEESKGE